MADGLYKAFKGNLLSVHLSLESLPERLIKWVKKNPLYRFILFIVVIVLTPARSVAHLYPVGRLVTGAYKTLFIYKGL
jgi:hypothetical protein